MIVLFYTSTYYHVIIKVCRLFSMSQVYRLATNNRGVCLYVCVCISATMLKVVINLTHYIFSLAEST